MMQEKNFILSATNAIMSVIAIILQVTTHDIFHRVINERKIIAKKQKTTFDVISQHHLNTDSMIYITYIECARKIKMLGIFYGL